MKTSKGQLHRSVLERLQEQIESGVLDKLKDIQAWVTQESGLEYTTRGISKLLERELGIRRAWTSKKPGPKHLFSQKKEWPTQHRTIAFLNRLYITGDLNSDIDNLRSALCDFLPEVDRVSIFIGLREYYDRKSQQHVIIIDKERTINNGRDYRIYQEDSGPSISDLVLEYLHKQRAPFDDHHPPLAIDYFSATGYYLATGIYWRRRSSPPITEHARNIIHSIEPFIIHTLTAIRAGHVGDRDEDSFHRSLTRMIRGTNLSSQEIRVVVLRILGHTYEEIALKLSISRSTVHKHVLAVHRKTSTSSIVEFFAKYFTPTEYIRGIESSPTDAAPSTRKPSGSSREHREPRPTTGRSTTFEDDESARQ